MSEQFTNEELQAIAEGAKARSSYEAHEVSGYIANEEGLSIVDCYNEEDVPFILDAICALPQLHQQVQDLQAANAALQAQAGAFEGLRSPDESPPLDYANDEAKYFRFEAYEKVEVLVRMPLVKQMHFGKDKKEGLVETAWQGGNSPFFGYRIPHEQVIGWRPIPDESPTAAESEEV